MRHENTDIQGQEL